MIKGRRALRKFHVTDSQNKRDQITNNRRSKCVWSNCIQCIQLILSGSPHECWLHTCNACIITTWPGLLEAWLVLTSVKYHGNLYILIPLNQRLALTRLRATGPWWLGLWAPHVPAINRIILISQTVPQTWGDQEDLHHFWKPMP